MQTALVFKQTSGDCSSSGIHHYAAGDKVKSSESSGVQESNNLNEESFNIIDLDNEDIGFSGNQSDEDPYARLQSHLDGLNVPPGIEVSVPWFINEEVNNLSSSTSTNMSNSDIQLTLNLVDSVPSKYSIKPGALKAFGNQATSDFKSKPFEKFLSGSVKLYTEPEKPKAINDWKKVSDLKRKYSTSNHEFTSGSKFKSLSSSSTTVASDVHKAVTAIDLDLSLASEGAMNTNDDNSSLKIQVLDDLDSSIPFEYLSGVSDVLEPWFTSFDESLLYSSMLSEYAEHFDPNAGNSSSSSAQTASSSCTIVYDDPQTSLKKFDLFKQFDTVEDHSDHLFSNNVSVNQLSKDWAKKIQDEWRILEKDLPDTIFVRVYESRMDLLRAVIIGAEGTPYHDGLFFFDMFFPPNYPNVPPKVKYHSGGLRINPNLYNCGKVCLSLLNTWSGDKQEMWTPCVSTVLQILVSIQGLILNAKPFFNEPGYSGSCGTPSGEIASMHYNERTLIYSLKTMVYSIQKPPKHFEDFIAGHFLKRADDIFVACKAYLNGAQVGCLVKGGVQDVEAGDKSCSDEFKKDLATYLKTFVNTIAYVGVTDCGKIISENESLHKLQVWRQGFCFRH